jgi:hypothetical protein
MIAEVEKPHAQVRGMAPKTKYEDIVLEVLRNEPFPIKMPTRTAKLIIESPTLAELDPDLEDFEGYQRRKAMHDAKRAEMQRVAVETGAPVHLLKALEQHPSPIQLNTDSLDEQHARAFQLGLDQETRLVDIALQRERNVQRTVMDARQDIQLAHRANPINDITDFYDIYDDDEIPDHRPSVPTTSDDRPRIQYIRELVEPDPISWYDLAASAIETTGAVANATGNVARGAASLVPVVRDLVPVASAASSIAGTLAVGAGRGVIGATPPLTRLGYRGIVGGINLTSQATRGVTNAMASLVQAGLPISSRGHDHLGRSGIQIADSFGNFMATNRY